MNFFRLTLKCTACGKGGSHRWAASAQTINCPHCKKPIAAFEASEFSAALYILSNPRMIDVFKIGYTERDPFARAAELSSVTGVPDPYVVEAWFPSTAGSTDEAALHDSLIDQRTNPQREFFIGPFSLLYQACRKVTGEEAIYLNPAMDISGVETYDPWQRLRPSLTSTVTPGRKARKRGNNFLCFECDAPMRPVKKRLQERGVFRSCAECGCFVDSTGREVSPRK